MIKINQNISLSNYSSMRLGGTGAYQCDVYNKSQLAEAVTWANNNHLDCIMIGGGNNIIWQDSGFSGLLIVNKISGLKTTDKSDSSVLWTIGSGENWDKIVEKSVTMNLTGIESLSLIPGTAGSTVIQNVGAYGQDISQTLVWVEAYDNKLKEFQTISSKNCRLAYRTSIFKNTWPTRYYISSITLNLKKTSPSTKLYPAVDKYLKDHKIKNITVTDIRNAVCDIRQNKLPNPAINPNSGSFFTNPVIEKKYFIALQKKTSQEIPHWNVSGNRIKVSAAWLIEYAGFKDFHDQTTGFATWNKQPLVLINEKSKSTEELIKFKNKIILAVQQKTNVLLTEEPEILPLIRR